MKIPEPAVVEYEPGGKTDNQEKNDQKMQNKNYFRHESISCLPSKFEGHGHYSSMVFSKLAPLVMALVMFASTK